MINKELVISKIDRLKKSGEEVTVVQTKHLMGDGGHVIVKLGEISLVKSVWSTNKTAYTLRVLSEKITEIDQKDLKYIYSVLTEGLTGIYFQENNSVENYLKS